MHVAGRRSVAIKPWRNQFATHTWPAFYTSVRDFRASKHNLEENRIKETELAAAQVLPHDITPRTIVLVIGESITRDNMSLYGYSRNTTPKLEALAALTSGSPSSRMLGPLRRAQ